MAKKSTIPLNNRRRLELQRAAERNREPTFDTIEQVMQHYLTLKLVDGVVHGDDGHGQPMPSTSSTPTPILQPQSSPPMVENNILEQIPIGLSNISAQVFRTLNEVADKQLAQMQMISANAVSDDTTATATPATATAVSAKQRLSHVQALFRNLFKPYTKLRVTYAKRLRLRRSRPTTMTNDSSNVTTANDGDDDGDKLACCRNDDTDQDEQARKTLELRDLFVRENQIQVLLSFLFMLKLSNTNDPQPPLKPKKQQMLFGLLSNCHAYFADYSDTFNIFLRRTLLFEPLIGKFSRVLSQLFKQFFLPVPPELQTEDQASKYNSGGSGSDTPFNIPSFMSNIQQSGTDEFNFEAMSSTPEEKHRTPDGNFVSHQSSTYEELMANMRKNPDAIFGRRLLLDTPSRTFKRPPMQPMTPQSSVMATPSRMLPPMTPSTTMASRTGFARDVTYTKGVDVAPTPDFAIATTGRKKKRKFMPTKKILNFDLPDDDEGDPEPKKQKSN